MNGTSNDNPMASHSTWKIGLLILCFLIPLILWLSSLLRTNYAIKHNKPIKISPFAHYGFAYCVLIPLGIGPFILIDDIARFKEPSIIFYVILGILVCFNDLWFFAQ